MRNKVFLTVLCCILACTVSAQKQKFTLSERDQQSIQMAAKDKVNRFQDNCAQIASEKNSNAQKRHYIKTALQDFRKDAEIIITSLNGKSHNKKLVSKYLNNLSLLDNRYEKIRITWSDCHITDEFEYDANTGMYVGWAKVKQRFNAETWERIQVGDVVERTVRIYAQMKEVYNKNNIRKKWIILLGDISARNIQ